MRNRSFLEIGVGRQGSDMTITMLSAVLATMLLSSSLSASSYYHVPIDDARAVYLTSKEFRVRGDGAADDSDAIQQAIDKVQDTTNQGILFIPAGRYRVTKTIYIWPGIRVIGFGAARPVFVLAANTPGFQRDLTYLFFFAGFRPGSASASRAPEAVPLIWSVGQLLQVPHGP